MILRRGSPAFLWAGLVAPILFTGVYLIEGATRRDYDPIRLQVSLLSLGDRGGIQVASFLVNGVLLVAFATALRSRLRDGRGALAAPMALGLSGLGMIVAGLFTTQPMFGYPPGAPASLADDVTPTSVLHLLGAFLLFFGLAGATIAFARRYWQDGRGAWAAACVAAGLVVLVSFGASGGGPSGQLLFQEISGLLQRVSLVTGLGWVAAIAVMEIRSEPS
jgi:Protein of unknown function (DUF998)